MSSLLFIALLFMGLEVKQGNAATSAVLEVCNYTLTQCASANDFTARTMYAAPGQQLEYKFFYDGSAGQSLDLYLPSGVTYVSTTQGAAPTVTAGHLQWTLGNATQVFGIVRLQIAGNIGTVDLADNFLVTTTQGTVPSNNVTTKVSPLPRLVYAITQDGNGDGALDGYELLFTVPILENTANATGLLLGNTPITNFSVCPARFSAHTACMASDNRTVIGFTDNIYRDSQEKPDLTHTGILFQNAFTFTSEEVIEKDGAAPVLRGQSPINGSISGGVLLTFSEALNPTTIPGALTVSPNFSFTTTLSQDSKTITLLPANPAAITQGAYTIAIGNTLTDFAGNAFRGLSTTIQFTERLLAAPTLTSVSMDGNDVVLNWSAVANATSYAVYYDTITQGRANRVVTTGTTTRITGLTNGQTYFFRVHTLGAGTPTSESLPSNERSLVVTSTLAAPTTVTTGAITTTSVVLTWAPIPGAVGGYRIEYDTVSGGARNSKTVPAGTTSTIIDGLTPNTTYYFRIIGLGVGVPPITMSLPSNEIVITLPGQSSGGGGGGGGGGSRAGSGGGSGGLGLGFSSAQCPYGQVPYTLPDVASTLVTSIKENILLPKNGQITREIILVSCANEDLKAYFTKNTVVKIAGKVAAGAVLRAPYYASLKQLNGPVSIPNGLLYERGMLFGTFQEEFSDKVSLEFTIPGSVLTDPSKVAVLIYNFKTKKWLEVPMTISSSVTEKYKIATTQATLIVFAKKGEWSESGVKNPDTQESFPKNLKISLLEDALFLSWIDPSKEDFVIEIFRAEEGAEEILLATVEKGRELYLDRTAKREVLYTYRIRARYPDGTTSSFTPPYYVRVNKNGELEQSCTPSAPFIDTIGHWGEVDIEMLRLRCIVSGKVPGVFAPEDTITRAELTKMVINAFGYQSSLPTDLSSNPFTDTKIGEWYTPYVTLGKLLGIVEGYEDGTFRPNAPVTRAEATKIILESANILTSNNQLPNFADMEVNAWYLPYINAASAEGVIEGYPAEGERVFKPNASITRAEAAKIIYRMME